MGPPPPRFPIDGPDIINGETDSNFDARGVESRTDDVNFPFARPDDSQPHLWRTAAVHSVHERQPSMMWTPSPDAPSETAMIFEEDEYDSPTPTMRAPLPIPGPPRFYSTPLDPNDPDTTPVQLYGLEKPKDYVHRRKPLGVRPKSVLSNNELRPRSMMSVRPGPGSRQPSPLASSFGPEQLMMDDAPPVSKIDPLERGQSSLGDRYSVAPSCSSSTSSSGSSTSTSPSEASTATTVRTRTTTPAGSTASPSPKMSKPYLTSASVPDLSLTLTSDLNEPVPPLPRDLGVHQEPPTRSNTIPAQWESLAPVQRSETWMSSTTSTRPRTRREPSRRNSILGISFPSFGSSVSSLSSLSSLSSSSSTRLRSDSTDTTETVRPSRKNTSAAMIPTYPASQNPPSQAQRSHEETVQRSYDRNGAVPRGSILGEKSQDARPATSSRSKTVLTKAASRVPDDKARKVSRRFSIWRG